MPDGNGIVYKVTYIDGSVDYISDEEIYLVRDMDDNIILQIELYEDNTIAPFWNAKQYRRDIGFKE